jgi:hypothetical protein
MGHRWDRSARRVEKLRAQGGKQPSHFVLGQMLANSIGRIRLAPSRCDWSHFQCFSPGESKLEKQEE